MLGHNPRKTARSVAVGVCAVLMAFACGNNGGGSGATGEAPADQQMLRLNDGTEPNSEDPTQQTYSYEASIGRRTFESLLLPKPDLTDVQGAAATGYDVSSDGMTYTFHLRPDAKWSDGKPVVAADWVYGFKHLLNPALAAGYVDPFFDGTIAGGEKYADVDVKSASAVDAFLNGLGLSAPDDHTFQVKLQAPSAYFKWVMTLWVAVPIRKDVVEAAAGGPVSSTDATKAEAWANDPKTIIGNGMYKISEAVAKDHITVVPNTGYWAGQPKIQKVIYYFITDANTAFAKYRTGDLDMLNVSTANVDTVRNDPKLSKEARLYDRLSTSWMSYNTKKTPLDNVKVQQALSKSIDRDKLANNVLHGTVRAFSTFIPKGMPGYDNGLADTQKFDPAAAKKLLQDAGVTPAQLSQLKLLTRDNTNNKTTNEFISAQWKENLGADIQLEVIDSKTVTSRIRKAQFDIYGPDGWIADYPDQQDWYDIFISSACHNLNWGCATLTGYDDLIKKADATKSDSDRNKSYAQAQKQVLESAGVGLLYQSLEYNVVKPYVQGSKITAIDDQYLPGDLYFHDIFIAKH